MLAMQLLHRLPPATMFLPSCAGTTCVAFCCALQGLAAKAEQLLVATFELQELRQQHDSLQCSLQEVQQQLASTSHDLEEAQ